MTPAKQLRSQSLVWLATVMMLLGACGGDGNDNDTIWTGLSGLVIVVIIGAIILRKTKK